MKPRDSKELIENSKNKATTVLGTQTSLLGIEEHVTVRDDHRLLHVFVEGPTGKGKTEQMLNAALQDCYKGYGLGMLIPKGKAIDELLKKLPEDRLDDVIYINPASGSTAINVLEPHITPGMSEAQKAHQKEIIVSDLIDLFRRQSANWGDRFGRILEALLHAHIDANTRNSESKTLLDVFECITDSEKLIELIDATRDVVVREQLVRIHEDLSSYELEPLQRRLNDFLINPTLRQFVSQKSSIDMQEAVNQSKIVLVDIQKGEVGDTVSQLIGSIIITQIWAAAQSRITQPPDQRTPFYLYIDELQNFSGEDGNFVKILSEAREYRLGCWLITQYLNQLPREMQNAVSANCRTKIVFNPDGSNNSQITQWLNGINKKELHRLGRYKAAIQTPRNGHSEHAATFLTTLPPWQPEENRDLDQIKEQATPSSTDTVAEPKPISHGAGANAGKEIHRQLLNQAKARLEELGCDVQLLYQYQGADRPDAVIELPNGKTAHLEAEHTTLTKPSKVLENLRRGINEGYEVIFVVKKGNRTKLENILQDPVNRRGNQHQDEHGTYSHYTDNGKPVTDIQQLKNADYRIIEAPLDEDTSECPELSNLSPDALQTFCLYRTSDGDCTKLQTNCTLQKP